MNDKIRKILLEYMMNNPCLSNEIDYLSNEERLRIYTEHIKSMTDDDVINELSEVAMYEHERQINKD